MQNAIRFRDKLRSGHIGLGTVISFNDPAVTEALCRDLDFVWIDAEHSPMPIDMVQNHIIAARASQAAALVRVAWNDPVLMKPVLDAGAGGIIVPLVRTVEDARRGVAGCKYPPAGVRGFGPRRPSEYGRVGGTDFVRSLDDSVLVILQLEHIDAANNIDEILAVPGISSLVIGPNDLSGSMGLLGQPRHPDVLAAIDRIIAAARRASIPVGMGGGSDPAQVKDWIARGVNWVAMGADFLLMVQALDALTRDVRDYIARQGVGKAAAS